MEAEKHQDSIFLMLKTTEQSHLHLCSKPIIKIEGRMNTKIK